MWMNPEERLKENPVLKNQFDGLHAYFDEKVVPLRVVEHERKTR